jgi:hypothetical protein
MTYDQSLVEVWKWKEEVSESLMNLTIKERLERIRERARKRRTSKKNVITAHLTSPTIAPADSTSLNA